MTAHVAITLGALGDFLLILPLLRELRRTGATTVVARGAYRALCPEWLSDSPFLAVDGPVGTWLFTPEARFGAPLAPALAGAVVRIFAKEDELLRGNLLRNGAAEVFFHDPRPTAPPHIVERFFRAAGVALPPDWLERPSMPAGISGDALWIHAGSGSPAKNLPLAFLAAQAVAWHRERAAPVVVSFGEADLGLRDPLRRAFASAGVAYEEVLCPTLAELRSGLASRAARYLGADTGVTHLAAALGKEVVVGFRATDPALWRPLGTCRILLPAELSP